MAPPDDALTPRLDAARAGSDADVWELLALCRAYLAQVAARRLGSGLRAKANPSDLVHDTLLEAHRDFSAFRGRTEAEWLAWLRRLLLHNIANFERRYLETAMRQVRREARLSDRGAAGEPAAPGPSPSSVLIAGERGRSVERCLERLPDEYRLVVVWHNRDGLPFGEIGRRLHRSADAVRRMWSRAIDRLQELMGRHERDE